MGEWAAAGALSVVLVLALGLPPGALGCPQPCACYLPTEVHCTFRSLAAVPARIPKHVERINFGFVWQLGANSFMLLVQKSGVLHARAANRDFCVYFLSRIPEMGSCPSVLYFKHCRCWHGEISLAFLFQTKATIIFK